MISSGKRWASSSASALLPPPVGPSNISASVMGERLTVTQAAVAGCAC